jgi:hypothetical protein
MFNVNANNFIRAWFGNPDHTIAHIEFYVDGTNETNIIACPVDSEDEEFKKLLTLNTMDDMIDNTKSHISLMEQGVILFHKKLIEDGTVTVDQETTKITPDILAEHLFKLIFKVEEDILEETLFNLKLMIFENGVFLETATEEQKEAVRNSEDFIKLSCVLIPLFYPSEQFP